LCFGEFEFDVVWVEPVCFDEVFGGLVGVDCGEEVYEVVGYVFDVFAGVDFDGGEVGFLGLEGFEGEGFWGF
jgi:hypothetical protein